MGSPREEEAGKDGVPASSGARGGGEGRVTLDFWCLKFHKLGILELSIGL